MTNEEARWRMRCSIKAQATSAVCDMLLEERLAHPELSDEDLRDYVMTVVRDSAFLLFQHIMYDEDDVDAE